MQNNSVRGLYTSLNITKWNVKGVINKSKRCVNSFLSANSIQFYSHLFCSASILLQWHPGQLRAPGRCVCVFLLGGLTWETNSDLSERNEWINKRTCAFPCKYRRMCVNEPGRHGKAVVTCEWMCVCVCSCKWVCVLTWEHKSRHFTGKCFLFASPFLPITVHFLSGCLASAYRGSIVPPPPMHTHTHKYTKQPHVHKRTYWHAAVLSTNVSISLTLMDLSLSCLVTLPRQHTIHSKYTPHCTLCCSHTFIQLQALGVLGGGADRVTNVMWYTRSHTTCNAVWEMCSDLFVSIAAIVIQ